MHSIWYYIYHKKNYYINFLLIIAFAMIFIIGGIAENKIFYTIFGFLTLVLLFFYIIKNRRRILR